MSKKYAIVIGNTVDTVTISDSPIDIGSAYEWIDLTGIQPEPARDWTYKNGVFSPPPIPPVVDRWVISKVAMISRFTPQEYVGIVSATKTDVEVQAWYDLFQAASRVDLKDQRTVSGINSLVGKNLLTQDRADTILTTPAQPNEIPS